MSRVRKKVFHGGFIQYLMSDLEEIALTKVDFAMFGE